MIKHLGKILGWNLGLLLAALLLVEIVFGGWFDAVNAPNLWRLSIYRNVDWRLDTSHLYAGSGTARYIRDRWGLRGTFGTPENIAILAVGGSTTDERFIDEKETWTQRLQACLTQPGNPQKIANAGVGGQSTRGHIRNFDVWFNHIPGLKPKRILAYIGVNETFLDGRQTEDDALAYNETNHALWWERAKLNSALYGLFRTVTGNVAAIRKGYHQINLSGSDNASARVDQRWRELASHSVAIASDEHAHKLQEKRRDMDAALKAYAARLQHLVLAIRKTGAEPIFITQTKSDWRIKDGIVSGDLDSYFEMRAINDTTLAQCEAQGISCIDVADALSAQDGDFYDSVHVTPQGSKRVAEILCQAEALH